MILSQHFPNFNLEGRVALLTGAGRGIGLGLAYALAAAGCAVGIQDIEQNVAEAEAENIRQAGGRALALGGDITDISLASTLIAQMKAKFGTLHILVNNAAIQNKEDWTQVLPETMETQWRANLATPLLLCQQALPLMQEAGYGRIINVGSIQGKGGNGEMMPYAMSKAALENMTKALARAVARQNMTVNLIAPGYFNTWRNRDDFQTPEDEQKRGQRMIPVGRVGHPEDCAGCVLMLCSEAGSYITGQTIYIDGGLSIR